jgi:hypothetical protein
MERLRSASGFLYCSCYLLIEIDMMEREISMVIIGAEVGSRLPTKLALNLGASGEPCISVPVGAMWLEPGSWTAWAWERERQGRLWWC